MNRVTANRAAIKSLQDTVVAHFSSSADSYSAPKNRIFYKNIAEHAIGHVITGDPLVDGALLDVGAGTGCATKVIQTHFPDRRIIAVEPAREMAQKIRCSNALKGVELLECGSDKLMALLEHFALIVFNMSFHWMDMGLDKVAQLLLPDGLAAISVPLRFSASDLDGHGLRSLPEGNRLVRETYRCLADMGLNISAHTTWRGQDSEALALEVESIEELELKSFHPELILERVPAEELLDTLSTRGVLLSIFGKHKGLARDIMQKKITGRALSFSEPVEYLWMIGHYVIQKRV